MRIEHVALYVEQLERMREFYRTYFGAVSNDGYHNPRTGLRTYFLSFSDGSRLELMNRPQMQREPKGQMRTGYIHLAFSQGSREAVDALTERLRQDGYPVLSGPRVTGDGYYESCVLDPEENQIELTVEVSDKKEQCPCLYDCKQGRCLFCGMRFAVPFWGPEKRFVLSG